MRVSSADHGATIYQRPVELLQDLIRFDTTNPPGNEAGCIAYIRHLLTEAGFESAVLAREPGRPNLVTRLAGRGNAPPLLLYGHVDVVTTADQTWEYPPFEGKLVDGYVWGRGALDMKGGVAMMLAALLRAKAEGLALPGDVILAIVSDEETGGVCGARYLVENHARLFDGVRYAIGEFGGFTFHIGKRRFYPIMVAEKQVCVLRAKLRGPGGHPGLAFRGGAMAKLARFLRQLDERPLPVHITPVVRWQFESLSSALAAPSALLLRQALKPRLTDLVLRLLGARGQVFEPLFHNTVCVTTVQGGKEPTVTPSEVVLTLRGATLPGWGPDELMDEVRRAVGDEIELELVRHDPGPAEPDMGLFGTLVDVLREADPGCIPLPMMLPAATDARFFSRLGIQTYGFLPMKLPAGFNFSQLVHGADERIPAESLSFGTRAICEVLQGFDHAI